MKRQWPKLYGENKQQSFEDWLEANIPKEELDRIAPPICENHEPLNLCGVNLILQSGDFLKYMCKHCGAEIKPSGWALK